ncbi:DUF4097 family beta strand repeat-containing protein [Actinoplanes sp. NPDC051343]|uniref:DUF4097 family beta strand repeat-containing protein n=1 Tax=Actinoplanes sp. NPDC051343 TaxID=3363906 RepID=UPI0037B8DEBC
MYEFDRATPVTVALRAHGGHVEITAEERSTVEVQVTPLNTSDNSREAAEKTIVVLEDDTLLVQVPGAEYWSWRRSPKLAITIRVPAGSALAGKSSSADVRAQGIYSVVQLNVASADVQVDEVTGDALLDAASGDLSIARVGGGLRIKSSSGTLRVGDVIGDVSAETASGDIHLHSGDASVKAKTASGDIEVGLLRQGRAQLGTASGDVSVGIAAGTGIWLDLDTASGKSTSDLTNLGDVPPTDKPTSLELRVRTASGDIHVHRAHNNLKVA